MIDWIKTVQGIASNRTLTTVPSSVSRTISSSLSLDTLGEPGRVAEQPPCRDSGPGARWMPRLHQLKAPPQGAFDSVERAERFEPECPPGRPGPIHDDPFAGGTASAARGAQRRPDLGRRGLEPLGARHHHRHPHGARLVVRRGIGVHVGPCDLAAVVEAERRCAGRAREVDRGEVTLDPLGQ
jgi:hypothetical protein